MQSAYLQFKHPNILRTSDELSRPNFFVGSIIPKTPDPRMKFGRESSSEVRQMLGCLKRNYENCIFIRERLNSMHAIQLSDTVHNLFMHELNFITSVHFYMLRLLDTYASKIAKICVFYTFWPVIQLISHFY